MYKQYGKELVTRIFPLIVEGNSIVKRDSRRHSHVAEKEIPDTQSAK